MDYIRFYHLRVYDRINAPMSMHPPDLMNQGFTHTSY